MRGTTGRCGIVGILVIAALVAALSAQSPEAQIRQLISQARQAEQREDLNAAAGAYLQILQLRPHWSSAEFNLALVYHSQRKYLAAITLLKEVLRHNPTLSDAHLFLGSSYFNTDQFENARRSLERFAKSQPGSAEVKPLLAGTYYGLGDYTRAATAYLQITADAPRQPEAYYHLTESYLALVRECLRELSTQNEAKYFYLLVMAEKLAAPDTAAVNLKEAVALRPERPEAYITEGLVLLREGKAGEAATAYRKALALAPRDCRAMAGLADAELAGGHLDEAMKNAVGLLPLRGHCFEDPPEGTLGLPRQQFGTRLGELERRDASPGRDFLLVRWARGMPVDQGCPTGSIPLVAASCLEYRGDLAAASRAVLRAKAGAPRDPETTYWALRIYLRLAQRSLSTLEALAPDSPQVAAMRAKILEQAGDAQGAGEQYARAAELSPGDAGQLAEWAKFKCRISQFDEAVPLLQTALSLEPDSARFKGLLGETFMMKNQPDKALPFLREAVRDNPEGRQARLYLAQALDRLNRTAEAIPVLEAAPYDPDGRVHYLLGLFHSQQGHKDAAARAFRIFKERRTDGLAPDGAGTESSR